MRIVCLFILLTLTALQTCGAAPLQLTPEEQAYLRQHPVVRVGIDRNWPPFDYFDPVKGHQGIASNYLDEVTRRLGLKVEYHPGDWHAVLAQSRANALDLLACAARTPQRETYLAFTEPYLHIDLAVFVSKQSAAVRTLDDLDGKTVALPQDNFLQDYLRENHPDIRLRLTPSNEEAIDLVALEKVDAYVGNQAVAQYFLEKNIITNVKIAFKLPAQRRGLGFAVTKNNPQLLALVQKALRDIDEPTQRRIRKQWVSFFAADRTPGVALAPPREGVAAPPPGDQGRHRCRLAAVRFSQRRPLPGTRQRLPGPYRRQNRPALRF